MRPRPGLAIAVAALALSPLGARGQDGARPHPLFETADRCIACHSGIAAPSGEDVSIGYDWRASMMANAARDPYWHAAVRRETIDFPRASAAIQDECSKCHMPMMRYEAHAAEGEGEVFAHLEAGGATAASQLALDGVSCTVCHQIRAEGLGEDESFVGGFVIDTASEADREVFGPFEPDPGRTTLMHSASGYLQRQASHLETSEVCATCHTLITHSLDSEGRVTGELPEQVPYQEWLHSEYRETKSCQSCHMPVVEGAVAISSVLGVPREGVSRHAFRGGNFFMLRMLNRYRDELGVTALPQELETAAARTLHHLRTRTASIAIDGVELAEGGLEFDVAIDNLAGHKLPTAYPSRRAWLQVRVSDRDGTPVFESGAFRPDGSIAGNDNDDAPGDYEPHYERIERADQVQIYESILLDASGGVTTGLLTGTRYGKDNRLLPRGFDPATAGADIAVHGRAARDADFVGGADRVRYALALGDAAGPFTVVARLWYQPIGYRWADNFRPYESFETERFVRYYDSMAEHSATVLAEAARTVSAER